MNSYLSSLIASNESIPFSRENQFKRFTYLTFMPFQVNFSSNKDENGRIVSWFQILCQYKSFYDAVDENGVLLTKENATIKTLTIKFSNDYIKKFKLNIQQVKQFFEKNIVEPGVFITLPINDEMPTFEFNNGNKSIVKNSSQATIYENFDLNEFIKHYSKEKKDDKTKSI